MSAEKDVRSAIKLIDNAISDLENGVSDEIPELFEQLLGKVEELRAAVPDLPTGRIEEFFSQVGSGLINAQLDLDKGSIEYNAAREKIAPATSFRIPKVEAEIKFALSATKSKGFNFLVFGSKTSASQTQQNSVKFEIETAPAPPGYLDGIALGAGFVTSFAERKFVQLETVRLAKEDPALFDDAAKVYTESYRSLMKEVTDSFEDVLVIVNGTGDWLLMVYFETTDGKRAINPIVVSRTPGEEKVKAMPGGDQIPKVEGRPRRVTNYLLDILETQRDALRPED